MVGRYVEGGRLDCVFGEGVTEREVSRVLVSLDLKASVVHMLISFRIGRFLTKRLAYWSVGCESVHDNQIAAFAKTTSMHLMFGIIILRLPIPSTPHSPQP